MDKIQPFSYLSGRDTFTRIREHLGGLMVNYAHKVHTEEWQGRDISDKPEMLSHELMNVTFTHSLCGEDLQSYRDDVRPNLPWADDHFEERVCGEPINPGVEWANWPWGNSADSFRNERGQFGHNYMERYWPKQAGHMVNETGDVEDYRACIPEDSRYLIPNFGIRNPYGDLMDLVRSLAAKPTSRQEWFPIFHPEDVGETVDGRKPCSLGYQFWVRGGQLHVYYPLRSCDYMHHMQDDIYLTIRLLLWVLDRCREIDSSWDAVTPGLFTMHCTSLHVFANDMIQLRNA